MATNEKIKVNGKEYGWPRKPLVVVCIDGGDPAYFDDGLEKGYIPNVARFIANGFNAVAEGTVPSVTCTNNMSLITGSPASVHGISGNFYLDPATGKSTNTTDCIHDISRARGKSLFQSAKWWDNSPKSTLPKEPFECPNCLPCLSPCHRSTSFVNSC